jgi:hypothetical protein
MDKHFVLVYDCPMRSKRVVCTKMFVCKCKKNIKIVNMKNMNICKFEVKWMHE